MKITIYGRANCPWCDSAKNLLDLRGWKYDYVDLFAIDPFKAQDIIMSSGMKTVPIIQVDDIIIGGFVHLEAYVKGTEKRNHE